MPTIHPSWRSLRHPDKATIRELLIYQKTAPSKGVLAMHEKNASPVSTKPNFTISNCPFLFNGKKFNSIMSNFINLLKQNNVFINNTHLMTAKSFCNMLVILMMYQMQVVAQNTSTQIENSNTTNLFKQTEGQYFLEVVDQILKLTEEGKLVDYSNGPVPGITTIKSEKTRYTFYNIRGVAQRRYDIVIHVIVDTSFARNFFDALNSRFEKDIDRINFEKRRSDYIPAHVVTAVLLAGNEIVMIVNRALTQQEKTFEKAAQSGEIDKSGAVNKVVSPKFDLISRIEQNRRTSESLLEELKVKISNNSSKLYGLTWLGYLNREKKSQFKSNDEKILYRICVLDWINKQLR